MVWNLSLYDKSEKGRAPALNLLKLVKDNIQRIQGTA